MTVKEVARLMGVTPLTIRNWDSRGKLQAYRHPVNNYRLYKVDDVERLMKGIEDSLGKPRVIVAKEEIVQEEKPKVRKLSIDIL